MNNSDYPTEKRIDGKIWELARLAAEEQLRAAGQYSKEELNALTKQIREHIRQGRAAFLSNPRDGGQT